MIVTVKDKKELAKKGKDLLLEKIKEAAKLKKNVIVAIPGGRSIQGIFKELAKEKDEVLRQVHFFNVDERVVPLEDEDSNFKLAMGLLFRDLMQNGIIQEGQLHPLPYQEARGIIVEDYTNELLKLNEYPGFDIVLLGVGEDGHVGALYPNHHSIKDDKEGFIYMDDSPKEPSERISASRTLIKNSRVAIAVFQGESKEEAFEKYLDGSISVEKCPVKIINKTREHIVLTDLKNGKKKR